MSRVPCSVSSVPNCEVLGSESRAWATESSSPPGCSHQKKKCDEQPSPCWYYLYLDVSIFTTWTQWQHLWGMLTVITYGLKECQNTVMLVKSWSNIFQSNNNHAKITISTTTTPNYRYLAVHITIWRKMLLLYYSYQMISCENWIKEIRLKAFFKKIYSDLRKNYGSDFHTVSSIIKRDYKIWAGHMPKENEPWHWECDRTAF